MIITATDTTTNTTYTHKTLPSSPLPTTEKQLSAFYNDLLSRLTFKRITPAQTTTPVPRFMQQTGNTDKKLILMKVAPTGLAAASITTPPFAKFRLPIGEIVADVTCYSIPPPTSSLKSGTTILRFYDGVYNATVDYTVPTISLPYFETDEFKKTHAAAPLLGKLPLGKLPLNPASQPPSAVTAVTALCSSLTVARSEGDLVVAAPPAVTAAVKTANAEYDKVVVMQKWARMLLSVRAFKPRLGKVKRQLCGARSIQRVWRGGRDRVKVMRILRQVKSSRRIQTRMRGCLARMVVQDMKRDKQCATTLQAMARRTMATTKIAGMRERKAGEHKHTSCVRIQTTMRAALARSFVADVRAELQATLTLQCFGRRVAATAAVARLRRVARAAVTVQCFSRTRSANARINTLRRKKVNAKVYSAIIVEQWARRVAAVNRLAVLRERYHRATIIQTTIRRVLAKLTVLDVRNSHVAATTLQTTMRATLARRCVADRRNEKKAATRIQSVARRIPAIKIATARADERANRKLYAAFKIQRQGRRFGATCRVAMLRRVLQSATRIQTQIRMSLARTALQDRRDDRNAAILIQTRIRVVLAIDARKSRAQRRQAAVQIQSAARSCRARAVRSQLQHRRRNIHLHTSSLLLQRQIRRFLAVIYTSSLRKIHDNITSMKLSLLQHKSTIAIQLVTRRFLAAKIAASRKHQRAAAIVLQTKIRAILAKHLIAQTRANCRAAVAMQATLRSHFARSALKLALVSLIRIQSQVRRRQACTITSTLTLRHHSAITIQSALRSRMARTFLAHRRSALTALAQQLTDSRTRSAASIQRAIRQSLARTTLQERRADRDSATLIQTQTRSYLARRRVRHLRLATASATKIQTRIRGLLARSAFHSLINLHNCAIYIQTHLRILFAQKVLLHRRSMHDVIKYKSSIKIQTRIRMCLARWSLQERREEHASATRIQTLARANAHATKYRRTLKQITGIQSIVRRRLANHLADWHRQWQRWETICAAKVQSLIRGHLARVANRRWIEYWDSWDKAIAVQARVRGIQVRKTLYFGGVPLRPKSPVYFTWVRHFRKELLEETIQEHNRTELFGAESSSSLVTNFDIHMTNGSGDTLFTTAAAVGWGDGLAILAQHKANANHVNKSKNSAAHMAFQNGFEDLGYYLVDDLLVDDALVNKDGKDCYEMMEGEREGKRPDMYLGDGALGSNIKVSYEED